MRITHSAFEDESCVPEKEIEAYFCFAPAPSHSNADLPVYYLYFYVS